MHPDASAQAHIDGGRRLVDVPASTGDELHGEGTYLRLGGGPRRLALGPGAAIDPQPAVAIDEQVGHRTGCRVGRERPEQRELVGGHAAGRSGRPEPPGHWVGSLRLRLRPLEVRDRGVDAGRDRHHGSRLGCPWRGRAGSAIRPGALAGHSRRGPDDRRGVARHRFP